MPTMMRDAAISFPLLGSWSIDPSASFTLFGRTFYWYGVIIAVGFILAMLYCARHCRRCGIEPDTLYDFLIWMIPLAIIGARLYYVIFQWSDYRGHPIDALKIWEGGLAIYGGVIAGLLTGIIWCRKKKIPFGAMADVCAPGLLIGQCIGRALIEGLRTDSLYIAGTGIRVSQLLAGVSAAAAAVVLALFYTGKLRHAPRYVDRGAGGQPDA